MMTLEEAIEHAEEKARAEEAIYKKECCIEHAQLAAWLRELKERRERDDGR